MVTAQILDISISFPSIAVKVNFEDDLGRLPQPQNQTFHIPVDSADGQSLTTDSLLSTIQGYINNYETALTTVAGLQTELNKAIDTTSTLESVTAAPAIITPVIEEVL